MRKAYIGLGSNMPSPAGAPDATLRAAMERLQLLGFLAKRSRLYSTAPVGFTQQPRFANAVVELETELAPMELLDSLLEIEREFGRNRAASIPDGPRTLDLDILLMDRIVLSEPGLDIPHPRIAERAFVLIPLYEIAPQLVVPVHEKTVAQLLDERFPNSGSNTDAVCPIEGGLGSDPGVGSADPGKG